MQKHRLMLDFPTREAMQQFFTSLKMIDAVIYEADGLHHLGQIKEYVVRNQQSGVGVRIVSSL